MLPLKRLLFTAFVYMIQETVVRVKLVQIYDGRRVFASQAVALLFFVTFGTAKKGLRRRTRGLDINTLSGKERHKRQRLASVAYHFIEWATRYD